MYSPIFLTPDPEIANSMKPVKEHFSEGRSPIHRMDPRVKILVGIGFACLVALSQKLNTLVCAGGFASILLVVANLSYREVFWRLAVVNGFVLFLWLFLPWTVPGQELFRLGPIIVSREGLFLAGTITLKSNAILIAFIALISSSSPFTLFHALSHLYMPDKIVHLSFFCYRYIFVIQSEYKRLRTAMKMRAFQPGTNLHTYRNFAYLIGMLLVKSFDRSERVYQAMLCRGFQGRYPTLVNFYIKKMDIIYGTGMFCMLLILLVIEWKG